MPFGCYFMSMTEEIPATSTMDKKMIRKIDSVLDRVQDAESKLSIAELGLIKRLRYSETKGKLLVYTNPLGSTHGCCSLIGAAHFSATVDRLTAELEQEFPDLKVEFV